GELRQFVAWRAEGQVQVMKVGIVGIFLSVKRTPFDEVGPVGDAVVGDRAVTDQLANPYTGFGTQVELRNPANDHVAIRSPAPRWRRGCQKEADHRNDNEVEGMASHDSILPWLKQLWPDQPPKWCRYARHQRPRRAESVKAGAAISNEF